MSFHRRLLQQEAPRFRGDPTSNLDVFCHEATFQECQESIKFKISQFSATRYGDTGSQKLRVVFPVICLVKTPAIAIWGNILFWGWWGGVGWIWGGWGGAGWGHASFGTGGPVWLQGCNRVPHNAQHKAPHKHADKRSEASTANGMAI